MIYQELTRSQFHDAFHRMGRGEQFSYDALDALYEFFSDMGEDYELDVIALCCEFKEYESIDELNREYSEGHQKETWDDISDVTLVLQLANGGAVIQKF